MTAMALFLTALLAGMLAQPALGASFPDVPPWHWAYQAVQSLQRDGLVNGYRTSSRDLAENSIDQVFGGFAHASAAGAQQWVERFAYRLPSNWPAPLQRGALTSYSLSDMDLAISGTHGVATFTANLRDRSGRSQSRRVRAHLSFNGQDWQADYADLAAQIPLFR